MTIQIDQVRNALQHFDFKALFVEDLGWDHHSGVLDVQLDGVEYQLRGIAHKRGMAVYLCPTPHDQGMPDYATRRKIERQVTKTCHEHFIIYFDTDQTHQIWQWVKREIGKPNACREHSYHRGQTGEALAQRLSNIVFTLEEEQELTLVTVAGRAQVAFDVERVTRRFYDYFKDEHASFLKFLKGIPDEQMKRWYVSVMLNRLMFIYFIQKKGFLDEDRNYLRNKLAQSKRHGKNRFYREFLCPLFFEGFAKRPQNRSAATNQLLGKVPYLNGGLFLKHQIEELHGENIQIPDSAFERVFDFFDRYRWHLDERPLRHDDEINPDVLGYIFEKYINQKQMGAYYTKEDITGYISRNTIIPFLFDTAKKECKVAFEPGQYIWKLLEADPDRYIYPAVGHGITCDIRETPLKRMEEPVPLPPEIEAGIANVSKRTEWNKTAPPEVGLPTEIWREVVARRQQYYEIHDKLVAGQVNNINDLITLNLDTEQFAQDVIENCEGPELLRSFWHAITKVTVLDPTCGSGAFLFAALNILETLYEASLDRMQAFIDELDRSGEKHRPEKLSDFRKILEQVEKHPSRKYYIYKSIIINNLYGVDIMDEAIEIAKLRLFLKLVAQVDRVEDIEPLPDIDFNIRTGNTLVGYATYDQVYKAVTSKLDFENAMKSIEKKASDVEHLSALFRQQQTQLGGTVTAADKKKLRSRLASLEEDLNHYLADEHGIDPTQQDKYEKWLASHKPFHWFIDFYRIMKRGGFDVVIGNPPYRKYSDKSFPYSVDSQVFATYPSRNLYAFVFERSANLIKTGGREGIIVQISAISTPSMQTMVSEIKSHSDITWVSNYATRPSCLFNGITMNLSIILSRIQNHQLRKNISIFSTHYIRWNPEYRPSLFATLFYVQVKATALFSFSIPKLTMRLENTLLVKLANESHHLSFFLESSKMKTGQELHYRTAGGRYFKIFSDREFGSQSKSNKWKSFASRYNSYVMIAVLSSNLWWWYYTIHFDMYNCKDYMIFGFPFDYTTCLNRTVLAKLGKELVDDLFNNAVHKLQNYASTGERLQLIFRPSVSKPIIDKIDCVLAKHYGFTEEELDFIINYDIKYRLGPNSEA